MEETQEVTNHRLQEVRPEHELAIRCQQILTIPEPPFEVKAHVVFTGMCEWWRLEQAYEQWRKNPRSSFLICGENTEKEHPCEMTARLSAMDDPNIIFQESGARHTWDQAVWAAQMVGRFNASSLAVYTSPFHMVRVYSTLLQAFDVQRISWVPMIPRWTDVSPHTAIPSKELPPGTTAAELIAGELDRLERYSKPDNPGDEQHVCSLETLLQYIKFLHAYRDLAGNGVFRY